MCRGLRSRYVVVATGLGTAYVPPIPGVELVEGYDTASVDLDTYRGKKLLIIGVVAVLGGIGAFFRRLRGRSQA